jgi:hypothetical protein
MQNNIKKYWKFVVIFGVALSVIAGIISNGSSIYGFIVDTYPAFEKNFRKDEWTKKQYENEYNKIKYLQTGIQRIYLENKFEIIPEYISNKGECKEYYYNRKFIENNEKYSKNYSIQLVVDTEDNILLYGIVQYDDNFSPTIYEVQLGKSIPEKFPGVPDEIRIDISTKNYYYHEKRDLQGPGGNRSVYFGLGTDIWKLINENYIYFEEDNSSFGNFKIKDRVKYSEASNKAPLTAFALAAPRFENCKYNFRFSNFIDYENYERF